MAVVAVVVAVAPAFINLARAGSSRLLRIGVSVDRHAYVLLRVESAPGPQRRGEDALARAGCARRFAGLPAGTNRAPVGSGPGAVSVE